MKNLSAYIKFLAKKYSRDTIFIFTPQALSIIVSFVTLPVILLSLDMVDYGKFQFVSAVQLWMVTFTAGHATLGSKRGIANGLDGTFVYAFLSRVKLVAAVSSLGLAASVFVYLSGDTHMAILMAAISIFTFAGYLPQVSYPEYFIAKKEFNKFAFWQNINLVIIPVGNVIAAVLTHDIVIFAVTQFVLTMCIGWAGCIYILRNSDVLRSYKEGRIDRDCYSFGIKSIPATVLLETGNRITSFIIGPFLGYASLATFSVAYKLADYFRTFIKSVYNLLYPDFAREEEKKLAEDFKQKFRHVFIISVSFAAACQAAAYVYIVLFVPQSYQAARAYFLVIGLGIPAVILQMILHTILSVNFRVKEMTILTAAQNIFKIFLIFMLGAAYGVLGICVAMTVSDWIGLGFYYFLTIKKRLA